MYVPKSSAIHTSLYFTNTTRMVEFCIKTFMILSHDLWGNHIARKKWFQMCSSKLIINNCTIRKF